jgi:hypothetical protein
MQLAGELTKISLPSLIQLLRNGGLTGKVCLTQGAATAFIYVQDGRLIHVETDADQGRAALLELFLWLTGSYAFVEADVESVVHSLAADEPVEKIIREGLSYLERKKHLDQLRISSRTVLKPSSTRVVENPVYRQLDGRRSLGDIAAALGLRRWDYINCVHELVSQGLVVVVEPQVQDDCVKLPSWVISRLRQDNNDITQAIVQMVIWVDRVKCWMYQADADLEKVVEQLSLPCPDGSQTPEQGLDEASAAQSSKALHD